MSRAASRTEVSGVTDFGFLVMISLAFMVLDS
jgi:hypothetical protein